MYKIAICDDDKRYRKTIREIVEHENSLHENEIRFYEYESGNELLKHTDILHELVFIDIRMPGLDGNQTALKLRNYNKDAVLIFCSSYFEPTVDSINFGQPFRYIMKDLHDTSLRREIAAIMTEVKRRFLNDYAVTVTSAGKIIRIHMAKLCDYANNKIETKERLENNIEKQIAEVWRRILGLKETIIYDVDFFQCGGNSLKAVEVIAEINHLFQGLELEIKDLFLNSTIKKISLKVEDELKKFMIVEEGTI